MIAKGRFRLVVICFHFSIFEPLETAMTHASLLVFVLWFAFILVSLNHWKQPRSNVALCATVVICFHFSIFEPLETARVGWTVLMPLLWFAFILVSLNHWKQLIAKATFTRMELWFAFILVSLNHWKQRSNILQVRATVVICFHFSIFEPLETAERYLCHPLPWLWFAFILVSLNHWKQRVIIVALAFECCDLLSF